MKALTTILPVLVVAILLVAAPKEKAQPQSNAANAPRYTKDGQLLRPENHREWVYLSSGLGMNYGPSARAGSMFTNVFVNPESYREFLKTGTWPDKTMFALEIYSAATHSRPNAAGQFQDAQMGLEIEVKDSSTPETWRYYDMGDAASAPASPKDAGCFACHDANAAVEHSFVQFYPRLLEVATAKGTIKAGINVPLNIDRFRAIILDKGWTAAEAAYVAEKKNNPHSMLDEHTLNMLIYDLGGRKKLAEAVSVAELVTREYPNSANAFDTLAEAYETQGSKAQAAKAEQRALELIAADGTIDPDRRARLEKAAKERIARVTKY